MLEKLQLMKSTSFKIRVLYQCIKSFKNWYLYPLVYFRIIKSPTICFHTKNNLLITLRTKSTDLMALTNVWLTREYSKPDFEIKDNDLVIDIGAHIGLFALLAAKKCKAGKIFCYEPVGENYELLLKNLHDNNLSNVYPFNIAVSDHEQKVKLYLNSDQAAHSLYIKSMSFLEVQSTTLKKIMDDNEIEKCNFLKIDCEGAEYVIIESLPNQYLHKIDKMIIEYHLASSKPESLIKLVRKLESNSFKIEIVKYSEDMGLVYGKRI